MSMSVQDCGVERSGYPRPVPGISNNVVEQFQMKNKVAVVTGGADGIGFAAAQAIAEAKGDVALWYNS